MTTLPIPDLVILFMNARSAAQGLREWVAKQYDLSSTQLDPAMLTSLPQFDQVTSLCTYFGYDVSRAPKTLLLPVANYMDGLRKGRKLRSDEKVSRILILAHRRVTRAFEEANRGGGAVK